MTIEEFFARAWKNYSRLTPDAPRIHELLAARGETLINDHVAFRTFNLPGIGRLELGRIFEDWGYVRASETLDFPEKKLKASYYLHSDLNLPKVFISELELELCSPGLQGWVRSFVEPELARLSKRGADLFLEPSWQPVRLEEYQRFYLESEYAGWTAAFGIQVNHFTVLVNRLRTFASLESLNGFLTQSGFELNSAGGMVKGTPSELLEQTSTMARRIPWEFAEDRSADIMGCYYEFARRYALADGSGLFAGFIPKSADKIFESTFERKPQGG